VFIFCDPPAPVADAFDLAVGVVLDINLFTAGIGYALQLTAVVIKVACGAAVLTASKPHIHLHNLTQRVVFKTLLVPRWVDHSGQFACSIPLVARLLSQRVNLLAEQTLCVIAVARDLSVRSRECFKQATGVVAAPPERTVFIGRGKQFALKEITGLALVEG